MKKSIYASYLILFALLLIPATACTTKTTAEKPQEPPIRQEQPAADTTSRAGDDAAQPATAETVKQPDAISRQPTPQDAAAKPDALSGATTDSLSGTTVSRQNNDPRKEAPRSDTEPTTAIDNSATQQPSVPSSALAAADEQTSSGTVPAPAPAESVTAAVSATSAETVSPAAAAEQTPIVTSTATASPTSAAEQTQSVAPNAEADTPDTAAEPAQPAPEQAPPDYETSLADLITDFERQGGSHGYEPPPTFHEQMLDLFSPQIFTVALSKEPETEQKPKVSRMVAVEEKQRLEITYPGHGWVYIGEQTSQQGLKYEQRKLQDENSIFMFTAEKKGDYVLHFSYFDVFTNDFITDAVAVSVSAARSPAAKSTVKAPDYQTEADTDTAETQAKKDTQETASQPSSSLTTGAEPGTMTHTAQSASETPQAGDAGSQSNSAETTMSAETTEAASSVMGNTGGSTGQASAAATMEETLSTDQLLEKARAAIASADAGSALTYLDMFFAAATQKLDEGWFLKGRAYELNGSARNIRLALDSYRMLTDTFPQSKYWSDADARIRYITGFYINIR